MKDRVWNPNRVTAVALALALGATLAVVAEAGRPKYQNAELLQPFLGPENSQWLVGPISWIAEKNEIEQFLALTSDEEAERFIEAFWEKRDPYPQRPDNPLLDEFFERAGEADRRFSEAGYPGRRTARGTIFVLYGEPSETDYEISPVAGGPPVEVWRYDKKAEKGLDDERPERAYRFIKQGDLTVFYQPLSAAERRRKMLQQPRIDRP